LLPPRVEPGPVGKSKILRHLAKRDQRTQRLAEYAMMLGVIAVGIIAILLVMRGAITGEYERIINGLR
jgi:Flp pilus assembly pilin Flp